MISSYLASSSSLSDHTIHLLFSANRWELASDIRAAIAEGITVIVDRYIYSGVVYSVAKDNPALTLSWARAPEVGLPRPDVVFFLEIGVEEARKRGGFGEERYEKVEMQKRVRELFEELKKGRDGEDFQVINAEGTVQDVGETIWKLYWDIAKSIDEKDSDLRDVAP
jgi:dTMP kinase